MNEKNHIEILQFENESVRSVIDDNGDPWFMAKDICAALDIINNSDAISRVDEDDKGVVTGYTLGGEQQMITVNECGIYALILTSRKPEAKKFKRWLFREVLPSIRKTGHYSIQPENAPVDYRSDRPRLDHYQESAEISPRVSTRMQGVAAWPAPFAANNIKSSLMSSGFM